MGAALAQPVEAGVEGAVGTAVVGAEAVEEAEVAVRAAVGTAVVQADAAAAVGEGVLVRVRVTAAGLLVEEEAEGQSRRDPTEAV